MNLGQGTVGLLVRELLADTVLFHECHINAPTVDYCLLDQHQVQSPHAHFKIMPRCSRSMAQLMAGTKLREDEQVR